MPRIWLDVTHQKQSDPAGCLIACATMALLHLGHETTQANVARILGAQWFGTPASRVKRLERLGVEVLYGETSLDRLKTYLEQGLPCLIFLRTGDLPYWSVDTPHTVLLVGLDDEDEMAYVNDPAFEEAPQRIPLSHFLLAWSHFDYTCVVVRPTKS